MQFHAQGLCMLSQTNQALKKLIKKKDSTTSDIIKNVDFFFSELKLNTN